MKAIRIFPQSVESAKRTEELKRQSIEFQKELEESQRLYKERNPDWNTRPAYPHQVYWGED